VHVPARDCGDWRDLSARGFVECQRYVAISAAQDVFAGGAEYEVAVATAIEEQDCLLVSGECFGELICQRLTHQLRGEVLHIYKSHFWEGEVHHAFGQADHIEKRPFCFAVLQRFE
jgi:hypothetical protein